MDTSVKVGLRNIWYVTGGGNQDMSTITNTALTLTATGDSDEYTITQTTGSGVSVTLASGTSDVNETIGGAVTPTSYPLTWHEFVDITHTKFTIRPYDESIDNGVPIYVPPVLDANSFEVGTLP